MPILHRVALALVLLAGLLGVPTAHAGALYRCVGSSGETVFASRTDGYKDCKQLPGTGNAAAPRKAVSPPKPAPVELPAVQLPVAQPLVARPPVVQAPVAAKGQWQYQETRASDVKPSAATPASAASAPAMAEAVAPGSRVLRGSVYRVVRPDGGVEYTNVPPAGQKGRAVTMLFSYISTCAACDLRSPINWDTVQLNMTAYSDDIRSASTEFGVNEALLRAIIHAESAFNPRAMSIKGAQGLMQLMPATAGDMGVRDAFDATQNIRGGARYLALLLKNFDGNERLAAAAYNAGQGAVQRYNGVPPYAETQVYVERVGTLRKRYGASLSSVPLADRRAI
jgi:soluble lytic murein transglycosylase-like protein